MELAKMYDAMTQELSDDSGGESDADAGAGSDDDSDFDSDSDWSDDDSSKKKKKKKNKKKKKTQAKAAPVEEISTPEILNAQLRPYQLAAMKWMMNREKEGKDNQQTTPQLHSLFEERQFPDKSKYYYSSEIGVLTKVFLPEPPKPRGGILADEMGLGKTVEVISLICSNRMAEQSGPPATVTKGEKKEKKYLSRATLVVTPLTIVDQWKHEIERHTSPPLKVYIYQGNRRLRDVLHLLQYDVIITTYNTLAFEYSQTYLNSSETRKKKKKEPKEVLPSPIFQMEFFRVVLDEAHNIKNRKSLQARATAAVEANRRWAVTGTPIQNHIDDLFSLFHFLRVNPHGDWRWWSKNIGKPFEKKDKRAAEALQSVISELVIRRTKDKKINGQRIVMLPPKRIQVLELDFSPAEDQFYKSLYSYSKGKFDEFVQSGTVLKNYANILEMLLHLRQVCNHPALIINSFQKKSERSTMKGFLENFAETCSYEMYDSILPMLPDVLKYNARREAFKTDQITKYGTFQEADVPQFGKIVVHSFMKQHWRGSTKINALVNFLKYEVKETTKSVVFSQWTSMLDLVEIALERNGIRFVRLDGRMQRKDREIAVENFKTDKGVSVCLISLKVGGIGLNLVWATHVFLLDPWWNPAIEQQAIDRVHRIGQEEEVHVIRFVVKNSVEERIMALQKSKTKIASDALDFSNRDEENDAENEAEVEDDEDDFEAVGLDDEGEGDMLNGFGMTKKDAQNVRIKDLSTLFT
jgi:SNF2 family DNA or RNA helicase